MISRSSSSSLTAPLQTYQHELSTDEEINDDGATSRVAARRTVANFVLMSVLFSSNHASVVSCLGLASARLGSVGAWQNGTLYLTYTGSALFGATYFVKSLGARDSLIAGMLLYCAYVGAFSLATYWSSQERVIALTGAAIGGVGAGFLWTAQGAYFSKASEDHGRQLDQETSISTSYLGGVFAFIYLTAEVGLRILSSLLLQFGFEWSTIFAIYSIVTIVSTGLMLFVHKYPDEDSSLSSEASPWYKVTAAWQLLKSDPKMKYMIGLNAAFGFASAFLNSYVNGEVVRVVLNDEDSKYVGILTAWLSGVAATMSLIFGRVAQRIGKGPVLIFGAICFFFVGFPFIALPDLKRWGWMLLVMIYTLHGTGRATFEGTLKATFADYFAYEKEGAFANIILQNGLSSAIGYVLTFSLLCSERSAYCVEFRNGTLHDVLSFELLVVAASILAILGYWRASSLHNASVSSNNQDDVELLHDDEEVLT